MTPNHYLFCAKKIDRQVKGFQKRYKNSLPVNLWLICVKFKHNIHSNFVDFPIIVVFEVRSNQAHSRDKAKVQIKPEDWQQGCCQSRCKYMDVLSSTVFWFCA